MELLGGMRAVVGLAALCVGIGACGDEVHRPCGAYDPDWRGVKCFMRAHCVSCHGAPHGAPRTTTVLPDDVLLDVANGDGKLVAPGDSNGSLLWRSVSGELASGDFWGIMPWGYDQPLPLEETAHIRDWIEAGAPLQGGGP